MATLRDEFGRWIGGLRFVLVTVFLMAVGVVSYGLITQSVAIKMNASGIRDGHQIAAIRAVDPANVANVLYVGEIPVSVQSGTLTGVFYPSSQLLGRSYVVEACVVQQGAEPGTCFTASGGGAREGYQYSCPYYMAESRQSKIANLIQQNHVEFDSRVLCDNERVASGAEQDFTPRSRIGLLQEMATNGVSTGVSSGLLVADENGGISVINEQTLTDKVIAAVESRDDSTQTILQQYFTTNVTKEASLQDSDDQTLFLQGKNLTITNGNTISFDMASATKDGILSASDYTTFAAKQDTLTFSPSFVVANNTVQLMSCASGQILKSNGTGWLCATDNNGATDTYSAGTGISINGSNVISSTLGTSIDSSEITDGTITASDLATSGATAGTYGDSGVTVANTWDDPQKQVCRRC